MKSPTGTARPCLTHTLENEKGFTLIELLAVKAIVATLAGIVSVSVSGTGSTSRDTQTREDANTIGSAAADFFSDQSGAEILIPNTVSVLGLDGIEQITSSSWPETYISDAYPGIFPLTGEATDIDLLIFLTSDDQLSTLTIKSLLEDYNAIDFDALFDGGFLTEIPDSTTNFSADIFNSSLWLFEKGNAAGSSEGSSRKVVVFILRSVEKSASGDLFTLTFLQLVGNSTEAP